MPHLPDHLYKVVRDNVPILCVDGIVVRGDDVLLVERLTNPYKGYWALPGGHVEFGETVERAVLREVREETGLEASIVGLVDVFSEPNRDPWGHIISIAYLLTTNDAQPTGRPADAAEIGVTRWFPLGQIPERIGFDHRDMIERARHKYPASFPA